MAETVAVFLKDADTGDEIEAIYLDGATVIPRMGESIHYWQDGFPDAAGTDSGIRRDFLVVKVEHDWRYMPRGRAQTVQSVVLHVKESRDER
jgi:hypothetical protein